MIYEYNTMTPTDLGFGLCCLIFGIIQCYLLFIIITFSQEIVDQNEMLTDSIRENRIQNGWMISDDPRMEKVIEDLKEFEGLDGKGYFTLNKPLLTGILANFITYIIILIQFSMTSEGSNPIIVPMV